MSKNVDGSSTSNTKVGVVLAGATTSDALCQLVETAEQGRRVREGMFLVIHSRGGRDERKILARVAEIIPYNDFYQKGDAWTEARRKGMPIPESVARRYEVCKLELLTEIPLEEIRLPPYPGDEVHLIDIDSEAHVIFGVNKDEPGYIWIGTLSGYEKAPIPLNVDGIPMHIAILGVTGSGKSFTTGALIEKLSNIKGSNKYFAYPIIVIDAHGDYVDYAQHRDLSSENTPLVGYRWVKRLVFPNAHLSLIQRGLINTTNIGRIGINLNLLSDRDLAELIVLFYKGTLEGAELQVSGLQAIIGELRGEVDDINLYFRDDDSYKREILKRVEEHPELHQATKGAIKRALENFRQEIVIDHDLLNERSFTHNADFIDKLTTDPGLAIIDFSADGAPGVDLKVKQFVTAYLSSLLFRKFTEYKMRGDERFLLFMIEEAQNFVPDKTYPIHYSLAHKYLSAIATQGRKFGLSLCLISQRPSFVDRIVLSMVNTFIIHRIAPADLTFVKTATGGLPESLSRGLTNMRTGTAIVTGQMLTVPYPLLIHVRKEDRSLEPTVGTVSPVRTLGQE